MIGGAGFIGSHLVDRLLADTPAEIVVFDNLSRGRMQNLAGHQAARRLRFVLGDIRDAGAVADTLRGADLVYHLAAQAPEMGVEYDIDGGFATNVLGTFNVLRAAARRNVDRFIFVSSHAAYGEPVSLPVSEGQPLLAINAYGASKAAGEV